MVGLFIIAAIVAAGITAATAAGTRGNDAAVTALVAAASKRAKRVVSERQVRFQLRAIEHGMPLTHAAHECTRANGRNVVCAAAIDGSGHGVFIDGVPHTLRVVNQQVVAKRGTGTDYTTQQAARAAYYLARDCDYVIHSAACTPAHVKARQTHLDARVGGHTGKVARQGMPTAKRNAMNDARKRGNK